MLFSAIPLQIYKKGSNLALSLLTLPYEKVCDVDLHCLLHSALKRFVHRERKQCDVPLCWLGSAFVRGLLLVVRLLRLLRLRVAEGLPQYPSVRGSN